MNVRRRKEGARSGLLGADADPLSSSPFKDGDLEAELAAGPRSRVLAGPSIYLGAGVLLVAGFIGGIEADQQWGADSSATGTGRGGMTASGTGPNAGGAARGGSGGSGGGGAGGAGDLTTGTVTRVVGDTVYLKTSDGTTVKVRTSGSTKISITRDGKVTDLTSGATVIVRGSAAKDGTVTATTVNEGSFFPGGGGFPGRGGPGQ